MIKIIQLLKQDRLRIEALDCLHQLHLPQCYLAAGFVRNLVWDHLHQKPMPTPLNDMDVIYYDANEVDDQAYLKYETQLTQRMPQVNWQVRNQANMHIRNGDQPYQSSIDAMSYWPEKETALAIRKTDNGGYECVSAFGFESLFALQITYNPKRQRSLFEHRVKSKQWLIKWSSLTVIS
ncbi:hypothetical protein GCM10007916_24370 [Psychromonas marina]|uniref:Nitrate reductase n=2 Tax=Psychromonas marina TaxID=88364 RepID=A0ABQ6E1T9_9GAMM|nr:hypothetical protein GCM10007916_24370 [Psychromonas marina]